MCGFPSTCGEDGMILVFVLRRIGSCGGARRWPLTFGRVVRDRPQSLLCITEGSGTILQRTAAPASSIDEEAARRLVSPGVEYCLTNYLTYVSRPKSGSAPFWAHLPAQDEEP